MGHPINPVPPIIVLTIVGDTEDTPRSGKMCFI